ncbi:MAG: hypothetical protein K5872_04010 [Rhizobiaceae bacterium]|nr:hypothetical protein [Rhizobiaceae bacterium]MCV0405376.1 hypothetical protein [Rhizobiaceae bacterium]
MTSWQFASLTAPTGGRKPWPQSRPRAEEWLSAFIEFCEKKGVLPDLPREELLKVLAHVELDVLAAIEARDAAGLPRGNERRAPFPLLTHI